MNILIAEDDNVSRRLLRGHLERWGHTVTESRDGSEAWDLFVRSTAPAAETVFPVVVIDWMMPVLDGLELIRRIRALTLPRYTYLLMLTAKIEKDDVVRGMDAGADDYLTKPFDKEELRARLQAGQRILDLQAALTQTEKSAAVGRLAVGVAAEISGPIAEVLRSLSELRTDTHSLVDALHPADAPTQVIDVGDPPRPARPPIDAETLRDGLGPRFVAAENKLHRVRELVRSLRDFSRIDEVATKQLSLSALVSETLSMCRPELAEKTLLVHFVPPESLPAVLGHPGKLKRALYNLLSFLIDFTPEHSTLSVTLTSRNNQLLLELAAPTPTLAPDKLPHLFEPFAYVGETTVRSGPPSSAQSGLGLPVAFSIAREHGGFLDAAARANGTVLQMTLPTAV